MTTRTPKFLRTLYSLLHVESPEILSWSSCGTYFQVFNITRLEQDVLPYYFKHSKFASFQRQLNNFGFRKWTKTRASVCTFSHDALVRCTPSELPAMVHVSSSFWGTPVTSHKRPRDDMEVDQFAGKKIKSDVICAEEERESTTDVSDLLALDWSVLPTDNQEPDELFEEDDCVGLPIELFFSQEICDFDMEPLAVGESSVVDVDDWRLLTECLA